MHGTSGRIIRKADGFDMETILVYHWIRKGSTKIPSEWVGGNPAKHLIVVITIVRYGRV